MNWIKSNPFVSGLAGITILLCGILYSLASKWGTQYDEAKAGFDEAYQAVTTAESIPLYPIADLRNGKTEALTEHREAVSNLTKLFDTYRPESTENITPQAFTDRLLGANEEVIKAFGETTLPENFFMGFEAYRSQLARSEATGALLLQMDGMKTALLGLAKTRPSAVLRVFRVAIPEETGATFQAAPNDIARYFSCEVTFKGSEQSLRDFLNSLGATDTHYFIIRTLKIQNERVTPPQVSDAKFEPSEAEKAADAPANPFGDAFFEQPEPVPSPVEAQPAAPAAGIGPAPANPEAIAPVAPPAPEVDTSRILAQVLGNEELIVFVRFDIAMFLPSKELPKP
ncbi:MAG: hypothetical protein RLZZ505_2550 [Verrucomicrobiota bacterium]|jgi:hypothetical protein